MDALTRHRVGSGARIVALALILGFVTVASAHDASHHAPAAGAVDNAAGPKPGNENEAAFLAENQAAMTKMMNDMATMPTGDVDRDFVAMMVPHHQGAIDMALAVLRYGRNEQVKRLAQEIIVTQQQEIAAMRLALGQPLPPSAPSPTQPAPTSDRR